MFYDAWQRALSTTEREEIEMSSTAAKKVKVTPPTYTLTKASDDNYVQGRRSFMYYRELGITEATAGKLRCQVMGSKDGLSEPTGWHIHICDAQVVHILSGWVDLEFAGGDKVHLEPGDTMLIPGGLPHNEIATSDAFELFELSIPADMGTEVCDPPA